MNATPRHFAPMHAHASRAKRITPEMWHVDYIRDFVYHEGTPPEERWISRNVTLSAATTAHFYVLPLEQFGRMGRFFAHTCLGFSFVDGTNLLYSIEARQPAGKDYDPRTRSENIRIFSTLDYFVGFRHVVRKRGFFRYPFTVPEETVSRLLGACLADAEEFENRHEYYHPITTQCTTRTLITMNRALETPVPWHPYWHLTRLTDRLLHAHSLIDLSKKETL